MKRLRLPLFLASVALLVVATPVLAQTYSFSMDQETVDAYWQSDGTLLLDYVMTFTNDASADPIDAVDIGLPTSEYDLTKITASVDGTPVTDIVTSPYVTPGIALNLGSAAIAPGRKGTVTATIAGVGGVLFEGSDTNTVSVNFAPNYFDSQYVHGNTDLTVTFHLPPGVKPEEPHWFAAPSGFPSEPSTGIDSSGRIFYTWRNPQANGYSQYKFGASFPKTYVPAGTVTTPTTLQRLGISESALIGVLCFGGIAAFFILIVGLAIVAGQRRKMAYLPPKLAVEGHGIKRGLTAVEAAILLETPLDRVLTMMLFSVIKKGAARVVTEKPLKVEAVMPQPAGLQDYELTYLGAIVEPDIAARSRKLQAIVIDMVKAVQEKMRGFSLRETRDYYKAIMQKAWEQVEQANTPEVKSEKFTESLEWTMLDRDFDNRTGRTFRTGPVFLPIWWGNFSPSYAGGGHTAAPIPSGRASGGPVASAPSLPHLPGSDFAASLVTGVQNTAGGLIASVNSFTGAVTKTTNPPPPPSTYSGGRGLGGGGHSCACACACAGCACACAGGGR